MKNKTLTFFNFYFLFTIIYYCFGKWEWNIPSYFKLLLYLFICYLFLNLGYKFRNNKKSFNNKLSENSLENIDYYNKYRVIFWISCIFIIIFQVVWVYCFLNRFSIFDVISNIGSNYYERLNVTFDSKVPIMQFRTLFWGLTVFAYPIGFIYFKKMNYIDRLLFIITICVDCLASLNMGVSKNIGDIIIIAIAIIFLKKVISTSSHKVIINKKVIILIVVFLSVFSLIQDIRTNEKKNIINPYGNFATINEITFYNLIFGNSSSITGIIDKIGAYTSHAYTGLAYSLELNFENTYFVGISRSLTEYFEEYLDLDIKSKTYNERIDNIYGWKNGQWWPTSFVWIANSFSFFGVPLIMFFIGYFIYYLELEYYNKRNVIVAIMYSQMIITLFYLPCNMQILQARQSLFSFLFLLFIFIFRNKRIIIKK